MNINKILLLLIFLGLIFVSCKTNKNESNIRITNNEFELENNLCEYPVYKNIIETNNNQGLLKHIIIENYDINIIKQLVKEICIRWDMVEKTIGVFSNQELLFTHKIGENDWGENHLFQYIAIYISDDSINIIIHDHLLISKWFDNISIDIINNLNNNEIKYEL